MQNKNNNKSGYTMIETMIVVSLFVVIVMAGIGALLNANLLHNKSKNMRSIMDNLSFIMEDISRNLRTGYNYRCVTASSDLGSNVIGTAKSGPSCWGVAFEFATGDTSNPNDQWVYHIGSDTSIPGNPLAIWKSTVGPYNTTPTSFIKLTPDEVVIDQPNGFSVLGAEPPSASPPDFQQPFVTIRLVGKIRFKDIETPFSLQTSVSQRRIDI